MVIKIGGEEILLRPTFENIAAMESNVGGVSYLGWKFSRNVTKDANGKFNTDVGQLAKNLPSMSECAKIIYYNQASTKQDDPNQKKYSLDEIWDKVLASGSSAVIGSITIYITKLLAGDKLNSIDTLPDAEKKSSPIEANPVEKN